MEAPNSSLSRSRYWRRVLRPLLWWLILVLILFTIRTHQRLCEMTRITFSVAFEGKDFFLGDEATATFDGRAVEGGQKIPIGWHTFTVSHSKAEPFSTNMFVWYGGHEFGRINLKRAKGVLEVRVNPPAHLLVIRGPEFQVILTNSAGMKSLVPTDDYSVEADYLHSRQIRQSTVLANFPGQVTIDAGVGTVHMVCNQSNAMFQVLKGGGELLEAGEFPATIRDVPEGVYRVLAWYHQKPQEKELLVKADITNEATIQFFYGAAFIESDPAGAAVAGGDGRACGYTPLRLDELPVGGCQFKLTRLGYEPALLRLEIQADQTNTVHTNLVSIDHRKEMNAARENLTSTNHDRALVPANAALESTSDDPEATK